MVVTGAGLARTPSWFLGRLYMFGLLPALYSAIVTGLLGTIPGRSFRYRVALVALVLSAGVAISHFVAHFLVAPIFDETKLPEGSYRATGRCLGFSYLNLWSCLGTSSWWELRISFGRGYSREQSRTHGQGNFCSCLPPSLAPWS